MTPSAADPSATPPLLDIEAGPGIARITLNRPAHRNRLHREDLLALRAHLDAVAAEARVRVLVLAAHGPVFCAGYHLGEFDRGGNAASEGPELFERTVDALDALAVPTIAQLQGGVYGGATDLALACDFRIGVPTIELRLPAARIGLHYYASGLRRFVARLGLQAAKRIVLLGDTLDAAELLRIGYLDRCVEADALQTAVQAMAERLAGHAPLALAGMKASLDEIAAGVADAQRLREREARSAASDDLREGLAALADRRPPVFRGR